MKNSLSLLLCILLIGCSSTIHGQIITTFAGNGVPGSDGNGGMATAARIKSPASIALDGSGNLYISDITKHCIRKVSKSGVISTVAGTGTPGYNADGIPAVSAQLNQNWGVAADAAGNLYISDQSNCRIRKVNTSGIISTIAGTGTPGYSGDNGPATWAAIQPPIGIAVDGAGNVYIGDPSSHRIRKISPSGTISVFAGTNASSSSYGGDGGPALAAQLGSNIFGLATDAAGNVYVCVGGNNVVRKINTSGIITTIAGTGIAGFSGDGGPAIFAQLNNPTGVYVDGDGSVFISDCFNHRIRKINPSGIITTIAGNGTNGYSGDDGPALSAALNHPTSIAIDANKRLYLADLDNYRIRRIKKSLSFDEGRVQNFTVCEDVPSAAVNSLVAITDYSAGLKDTSSLIYGPFYGSVVVSYTATATGNTVIPSGLYYTPVSGFVGTDTFRVRVTNGLVADTTTVYVTVIPSSLSAGSITGDSNVCVGSSITLHDNVPGGVWNCSNGNAKISPAAEQNVVTGLTAGTDIIMYTISNSCGTASASKTITVNPLPDPGTITGASAVCNGSTITLSENKTGGTWSSTNSKTTISQGAITGMHPGRDTIRYLVTNTFCAAAAIHPVMVDTFPNAGIITGLPEVCVGATITLKDPAQEGSWSHANLSTIVSGGYVTGKLAGMDTISYSVTNSCGTDVARQLITVKPLPMVPTITQDGYSLYAPAGYTTYQWTRNGIEIPDASLDSCVVANSGTYAVSVTDSFGCAVSSPSILCQECSVNDLKIFPNPVVSSVYIKWCKSIIATLTTLDGRKIMTLERTNEIYLNDLPDGVYIISIYNNDGDKIKTTRITKLSEH